VSAASGAMVAGASAAVGPAPLLLGALVGALIAGRFETALLCLAVAAAGAAACGAGLPRRGLWLVLGGGALISVGLNAYLTPGAALPLPVVAGHAATVPGAALGALLALRVWGAAIAVHGLAAAWPGERAADEIAARLAPLERVRIPVARARAILGLGLRFVPLLADEIGRVRAIQDLRAGRAARGMRARARRLRSALVPALTGALERAERVALALEARHYRLRRVQVPRAHRGWQGAGLALAALSLFWRG